MASETASASGSAAAPGGRRDDRRRRRELAREKLLAAAAELAAAGPFLELSVDRIATEAGLSRPAFYNHFRDKNDLLLAALAELEADLDVLAASCWATEGPPAEQVRAAVEAVVSFYADNLALLRAVTEAATYDAEVAEAWSAVVQRLIEATAEHVRAEQGAGLIGAAIDPDSTSEALTWMAERCCHVKLGARAPDELVGELAPVWTAALYPGVIPADQLRPGPLGTRGPWGMSEPEWEAGGDTTGASGEASG